MVNFNFVVLVIVTFVAALIYFNFRHIKKWLFGQKRGKSVQSCPKCGSTKIRESNVIPIGDPILRKGFYGWECLDCGYSGKDFFVVDEKRHGAVYSRKPQKRQAKK